MIVIRGGDGEHRKGEFPDREKSDTSFEKDNRGEIMKEKHDRMDSKLKFSRVQSRWTEYRTFSEVARWRGLPAKSDQGGEKGSFKIFILKREFA